jgi:hypothetical protein
MTPVLEVHGVTDLDLAELKKELRQKGLSLDEIGEIKEPSIGSNRVGDPGTALLLINLGTELMHLATPVLLGILGAWVAKGRSRNRKNSWEFVLKKGELVLKSFTSDQLVEQQTPDGIEKEVLSLIKAGEQK